MATTIGGPGGFVDQYILAETPGGREQLKNISLTAGGLATGSLVGAAGVGLGGTALAVGAERFAHGLALGESVRKARDNAFLDSVWTLAFGTVLGKATDGVRYLTSRDGGKVVVQIGEDAFRRLPGSMRGLFTKFEPPGVAPSYAMEVPLSSTGRYLTGSGSGLDLLRNRFTRAGRAAADSNIQGDILRDVRKLFRPSNEQSRALGLAAPDVWGPSAKKLAVSVDNASVQRMTSAKMVAHTSDLRSPHFANLLGHEFGYHYPTYFREPLNYPASSLTEEALPAVPADTLALRRYREAFAALNPKHPVNWMARDGSQQSFLGDTEYYSRAYENAARLNGTLSELASSGRSRVPVEWLTGRSSFSNLYDGVWVPGYGHQTVPTFFGREGARYVHSGRNPVGPGGIGLVIPVSADAISPEGAALLDTYRGATLVERWHNAPHDVQRRLKLLDDIDVLGDRIVRYVRDPRIRASTFDQWREGGRGMRVGDLLDVDDVKELFAGVPNSKSRLNTLVNIPVVAKPGESFLTIRGVSSHGEYQPYVSEYDNPFRVEMLRDIKLAKDYPDVQATFLHELQHALDDVNYGSRIWKFPPGTQYLDQPSEIHAFSNDGMRLIPGEDRPGTLLRDAFERKVLTLPEDVQRLRQNNAAKGSDTRSDAKGGNTRLNAKGGKAAETFDTPIPEELKAKYDTWYAQLPKNLQYTGDYDLQGAWLERLGQPDKYEATQNGHLDDYGKKPNHITFSTGSKWHDPKVPERTGGEWRQAKDGSWDFYPGTGNKASDDELEAYFEKYEKGNRVHRRVVRQDAKGGNAGSETAVSETPVSEAPQNPGGPRIVLNPAVFHDKRDALCVTFNEAIRIVCEMNGFEPVSEPTEKQRRFFADTAYASDELQLRRTILARIATLDTSVSDPTDEQLEETAEMLEMVMEVGAPQNEWEQQAVQRLHDVVVKAREGHAQGEGEPLPPEP